MIKTFCDRCGKETSANHYHVHIDVGEITEDGDFIRKPLYKDLCPMCYAVLKGWMEEENGK